MSHTDERSGARSGSTGPKATGRPARPGDGDNRLRRGTVSFAGVLAQSVSVMAPAMSGAFITYLAAVKAGGATPLAFVLATVSCLLIGAVVSSFAARLPSAGSLYTYVTHGLGPAAGFVVGWCYAIAFALVCPAVLAGFAVFTSLVMTDLGAPGVLDQWTVWFVVGLVVYFALSYFGIEFSTAAQLVFTALTVAALLLLAGTIIGKGGESGNTLDAFSPGAAGVGWTGVLAGMAFGILSFVGFEASAVLAEETRNPRRMIPLAVIGSVLFGGAFYVLVTYATSIGYGVPEATIAWPDSATGIVALADPYAGYLTNWVLLAGAVSALLAGLGAHNAVTRIGYVMGRDGVLPRSLGRTHPRYGTPHIAILANLGLIVSLAVVMIGATGQSARDTVGASPGPLSAGFYLFAEGLTLVTPLFILSYAVVSVAGLRAATGHAGGTRDARHALIALGALLACAGALYGSLYYSFVAAAPGADIPGPYRAVPIVGMLVVGTGAVAATVIRRRRPQSWTSMGSVFE